MNTIAIDCRFASTQSGLGRYTRELVTHLIQIDHASQYVLFVRSVSEDWVPRHLQHVNLVESNFSHYSLAEQCYLPRLIRRSGADLFFSPHFNVPFFCPVPYVMTVHDLILHHYPNEADLVKKIAYSLLMAGAIRRASRIITVSNFVRQELIDSYGQKVGQKISVVPESVSDAYRTRECGEIVAVKKKYSLDKPYFLYVGNCKEHKNVSTLIGAFFMLPTGASQLILVTGGKEVRRLGTLPSGVRVLSGLSDDEMSCLYSGALSFVTASLYEGFCLPIAEALACGCSVIAPNRTAIPETASGRAALVEPTPECLAAAMNMLSDKPEPFIGMTWEESAAGVLRIFRSTLRKSPGDHCPGRL